MYVKSWIDIRLKLPVPSLIVSINFPVGNRVNPPQSYTNMKISLILEVTTALLTVLAHIPLVYYSSTAHILLLPIIL